MYYSLYSILALQVIIISLGNVQCSVGEVKIQNNNIDADPNSNEITAFSDNSFDDNVDENDADLEDRLAAIYVLLKHRYASPNNNRLNAKRANYDSFDESNFWMNPASKRAFKLLRVGRSIGSMAHRLPRMGKK